MHSCVYIWRVRVYSLGDGKYIFHDGECHSIIETVMLSAEVVRKLDLMRDGLSCSYADLVTRIIEDACLNYLNCFLRFIGNEFYSKIAFSKSANERYSGHQSGKHPRFEQILTDRKYSLHIRTIGSLT